MYAPGWVKRNTGGPSLPIHLKNDVRFCDFNQNRPVLELATLDHQDLFAGSCILNDGVTVRFLTADDPSDNDLL
jgi:hypothetical protein